MKVAGELDFLVVLTPLTPETRDIVGEKVFAAMKPTAYLVNVARGGVVDEPALIAALEAGKIAGAGLDVFSQEPLPSDNPLWKTKNVTIFSHLGGYSQGYEDRAMPTIAGNMAQISCRRSQIHDQHRAQARILERLKPWPCPNA